MQIAILLNETGVTSSLNKGNRLVIYIRKHSLQNEWRIIKEYAVALNFSNISAFKTEYFNKLKLWLGECKILVFNSISGDFLHFLESEGFHVWEISGFANDFLDYVAQCELQEQPSAKPQQLINLPQFKQIEEEEYLININITMSDACPITSKQLLLPFLKSKNFKILKVICQHVPRWFEKELANYQLTYTSERFYKDFLVIIKKESVL